MLWGLKGIQYAQPAADVMSAVIALCMAIRLNRDIKTEGDKDKTEGGRVGNTP